MLVAQGKLTHPLQDTLNNPASMNVAGVDIVDVPNQLDQEEEKRIVRKITWRLMPYMMWCAKHTAG